VGGAFLLSSAAFISVRAKPLMDIKSAETYSELSRRAADLIVGELKRRPDLLFCASAGNTPTLTYQLLAAKRERQPHLFSKIRVLQLDEWAGLPRAHPASCYADLKSKLLAPLRISLNRFRGFRGDVSNPETECKKMKRWLAAHDPIDLCLLGLGKNGHIAMNEPAANLMPQAHVTKLTASSRKHTMLAAVENKPRYGMTLGIAEILASRQILLLVSGASKAAILKRLLESPVTTRLPASFLWLHPNVTILCDRDATR
jgi:galactosamine-6-phosphate isomerase